MGKTIKVSLTETPRDAMQGWHEPIPAQVKAKYINSLLLCGFDFVDVGSFVSPKAVPQLADTPEVLSLLNKSETRTKIMVIVGNTRGGERAVAEPKIHTLGFPHSVSETFLKRNLNTTIHSAQKTLFELNDLCRNSEKTLRIYITMAFGNPYGDMISDSIVLHEIETLYNNGLREFVLSDITGNANPAEVERLCSALIKAFPESNFGLHLHCKPNDWEDKINAALQAGIQNYESAIGGYGGCPFTGYELLSNLNTMSLLQHLNKLGIETGVDEDSFYQATLLLPDVFK